MVNARLVPFEYVRSSVISVWQESGESREQTDAEVEQQVEQLSDCDDMEQLAISLRQFGYGREDALEFILGCIVQEDT